MSLDELDKAVVEAKINTMLALLARIEAKESLIMSAITDWAAKEQVELTAISTILDAIAKGVIALDTLIQNLQNSSGTLSASDQAALDAIAAASSDLATKAGAINTNPPNSGPQVIGIAPNTGAAGSSVDVTINGSGFSSGQAVKASDPGITVSGVTVVSPAQITASLAIGAAVPVGSVTVAVGASSINFSVTAPVGP